MMKTNIFKSNRTQAVRLPKAVAFPEAVSKVEIYAIGQSRLITPAGSGWDDWFEQATASTDFMTAREQETDQQRESF